MPTSAMKKATTQPGGQFPARRRKFPARLNKFPVRRELIPCFICRDLAGNFSLLAGNLPRRPVRRPLRRARQSDLRGFISPWGESPTFPRVTRADPSLWSVIFRISVRAGRVLGAGLWSPFFNFPFGGAETGSIADRDRFAGDPWGVRRTPARSPQLR
jgi:hypothetical protein